MAFTISPSPRVRRSPFFDATVEDGVSSFSPYNHMLMPTGYGNPEAEYWRLINGVSMWDVSVERQVEITGVDAAKLIQILTPRKLDKLKSFVGWYVPICDHRGSIINDPILLKLAEDRYWLSIADSDVLLWSRAIAAERGLDVQVFEPDVSPLAIQGPKAEDVVAALLGESIRDIRYFQFRSMSVNDIPLMVARSGWSKQGGFELYLMDGSRGYELWQLVKEAGQPWDIGPGTPNSVERIESGLLSWGGDTDDHTNPFEIRMGKYVHLDAPDDVVGIKALRKLYADGIKRHQVGIFIDLGVPMKYIDQLSQVMVNNLLVGKVTAHVWSRRLQRNIGIALVDVSVVPGDTVVVKFADGLECNGEVTELPFI